jgi:hypothetical protein
MEVMRRLIPALIGLLTLAAACGGSDAAPDVTDSPTPRPSPTRTRPPTRSPSPTPAPTPVPVPTVDLSLSAARQGGFMVVRLVNPPSGLTSATTYFNSRAYAMTSEGDHLFAVVGLSTAFAVGQYPVEVSSETALIAAGLLTVNEGGFEFISIELPPSSISLLQDEAAIAQERATLAQVYANVTPAQQWSGAWIMPAQGIISNAFGVQRSINGGPYYPHTGTDIANNKGTPVVAAASGTVVLAQALYLYGNAVVIDHGAGVFTSYKPPRLDRRGRRTAGDHRRPRGVHGRDRVRQRPACALGGRNPRRVHRRHDLDPGRDRPVGIKASRYSRAGCRG